MSYKPEKPTLIRYWKYGYSKQLINAFVNDWESDGNSARFTIPPAHPLQVLWQDMMLHYSVTPPLTVYSTDELEWTVTKLAKVSELCECSDDTEVTCRPRLKLLRENLITDDYLIWLWLEAEKTWTQSGRSI